MGFSLPPPIAAAAVALAMTCREHGIEWVATGGVARALQGFDTTPGDLDVEVDEAACVRAAAALGLEARSAGGGTVTSVRAVGSWHGVALDMSGGVTVHGPGGHLHADFAVMRAFARRVVVDGQEIWAAPVEEQIARALVAGDGARLDRIADERPSDFTLDDFYLAVRLAAASASR